MKNRKTLYIWIALVVVIIAISVGIIIACTTKKTDEKAAMKNEEFQGDIEYGLNSVEQGETNEILNEIVVNEIENTISNEVDNNTVKGNNNNTSSTSETMQEDPKTAEEKAIEIVKEDWKAEKNVEFSIDGMDGNGNYIVTVRNSSTTEALAFYNVNISTKKFTKREMN